MAAVGWSGFFGDTALNSGGYTQVSGKWPRRTEIKRVVNREGFRAFTALMNGLIGAATGSNVTATHKQIAPENAGAMSPPPGGLRTINTITDINRNTTAADVTALKEMVFGVSARPATYPADLSGNGGKTF